MARPQVFSTLHLILALSTGECITPDDVFEVLEEDMEEADLILWVGISFEQSASTSYFRKAREFLLRAGRWQSCIQAIINLSEDAHFNLLSACNNIGRSQKHFSSPDINSAALQSMPCVRWK